ncbi:aminoacyl--tRNA ligase-related protein [Patescibacteria group bacterium]
MKQSKAFIKTLRQPPAGEKSANAKLLEQAGYISKLMAGVYTYLPLGLKVFNNISNIIRKEMYSLGAEELYMPALQPKELWNQTNRWQELSPIMYQFKDNSEHEVGLATTHEETITLIMSDKINSYKDLPFSLFQIQDKFRDEPRARSGLIRGREFSMKDLYSFHADEDDLNKFYDKSKIAYHNIFNNCGLEAIIIEASGGSFTKQYSHEFQVICESGEDKLVYCQNCKFAQNKEISKTTECPNCKHKLNEYRGIEVGNIFKLGTKFSKSLNLNYSDKDGKLHPVVMASYGIGPGRVMATIVEVNHDQDGIIWPTSVAPYELHLLLLSKDKTIIKQAEELYITLSENHSILFDDRSVQAGVKLKDSDLIGIPHRLILSDKTTGGKLEYKKRSEKKTSSIDINKVTELLKND